MPSGSRRWLRAEIESVAENRLVLVKFAAHVHVLRALAGEEKDGRGARGSAGDQFFAVDAGERGDGFGLVFDDDGAAMRKGRAAKLAGESSVGKVQFGMRGQVRGEIREGLIGGGCGFCGDGENLIRLWLARERGWRRFFQHNVRVGAADAERSDAGAARLAAEGQSASLLFT